MSNPQTSLCTRRGRHLESGAERLDEPGVSRPASSPRGRGGGEVGLSQGNQACRARSRNSSGRPHPAQGPLRQICTENPSRASRAAKPSWEGVKGPQGILGTSKGTLGPNPGPVGHLRRLGANQRKVPLWEEAFLRGTPLKLFLMDPSLLRALLRT